MDDRSTLYPFQQPHHKTLAERQHGDQVPFLHPATVSTFLDFRAAAEALALRNIETCPGPVGPDVPLGICQECLRGCENWREIVHAPSCQTGCVLALYPRIVLALPPGDVPGPPPLCSDPDFVETYSIVLDPPAPFGKDGAR